jgi:hypothetical protein
MMKNAREKRPSTRRQRSRGMPAISGSQLSVQGRTPI